MGEFSPFTTGRGPSFYFVIPSLKPFGKFSPWKLDGIGEPFSGPANFKGLLMLVLGRVFLYKTCGNIDPWTCQMFVSFVILYVCGKLQDADVKTLFFNSNSRYKPLKIKMVHLKITWKWDPDTHLMFIHLHGFGFNMSCSFSRVYPSIFAELLLVNQGKRAAEESH